MHASASVVLRPAAEVSLGALNTTRTTRTWTSAADWPLQDSAVNPRKTAPVGSRRQKTNMMDRLKRVSIGHFGISSLPVFENSHFPPVSFSSFFLLFFKSLVFFLLLYRSRRERRQKKMPKCKYVQCPVFVGWLF